MEGAIEVSNFDNISGFETWDWRTWKHYRYSQFNRARRSPYWCRYAIAYRRKRYYRFCRCEIILPSITTAQFLPRHLNEPMGGKLKLSTLGFIIAFSPKQWTLLPMQLQVMEEIFRSRRKGVFWLIRKKLDSCPTKTNDIDASFWVSV